MRFPHRDFTRDWNPGDSFCRCRSIKMGFYHHIGIDRVEFMFKKHVKRWVQFVDTVICVTNTTDYTEPSASDFAPKWFSHFWMTARMLPKQAHPGRLRRPGTGGFAARGGGHMMDLPSQGHKPPLKIPLISLWRWVARRPYKVLSVISTNIAW